MLRESDNTLFTQGESFLVHKMSPGVGGREMMIEHNVCVQLSKHWTWHLNEHLRLGTQQDPPTSSSICIPENITTPCTRARNEITRGRAANIQAPHTRNFLCHNLWLRFPKHFHYQWRGNLPQALFYSPTPPARKQTKSPLSHSETSRHQVLQGKICSNQSVKSFIEVTEPKPTDQQGAELCQGQMGLQRACLCLHGAYNQGQGHDWLVDTEFLLFPPSPELQQGRGHVSLICCKTNQETDTKIWIFKNEW